MPKGTAVFLDTSILIASLVHPPRTKKRIKARLKAYDFACSGTVVRAEMKRRLFKDAIYLHKLVSKCATIQEVNRRLEALPHQQFRRFRTCLQIVHTIDETDDDRDRLDRARLFLEDLLRRGMDRIERRCHFLTDSACAIGKDRVRENPAGFDAGPRNCSRMGARCGIVRFLEKNRGLLAGIREYLGELEPGRAPGRKSDELASAERFIAHFMENPSSIQRKDPCLTAGDLLIALESQHIPDFYTMNGRESQHLCRVLKQRLIVRPNNPDKEEVECDRGAATWPEF
ncbi:MAG TPA: hypothetical protein VM492_09115 [Sumerlaeia bacterium]|nr:hypothetical protein [Sumerlaeia bacterium]